MLNHPVTTKVLDKVSDGAEDLERKASVNTAPKKFGGLNLWRNKSEPTKN